jgi:hypothetical protein
MMIDEELTEDLVSEPWRHATMHVFNVQEHDDLWCDAKRCIARANCH